MNKTIVKGLFAMARSSEVSAMTSMREDYLAMDMRRGSDSLKINKQDERRESAAHHKERLKDREWLEGGCIFMARGVSKRGSRDR